MQREYGVDLSGLWRGELSVRRAWVLIQGLPHDSRSAFALSGEDLAEAAGWRLGDLLIGRLADELALFRWQWESAHIDPKKSRPRKQPPSVLPELREAAPVTELRLVSPHRLGGFVNDTEEVTPHGD